MEAVFLHRQAKEETQAGGTIVDLTWMPAPCKAGKMEI